MTRLPPLVLAGIVLALPAWTGGAVAGQAPGVDGPLRSDRPVERRLAAGEVHSYRLEARSRELLRVSVDERGADVDVRLYAPDGSLIQQAGTPGDADALVRVFVEPEAAATYRLEVAAAAPGRYQVVLRSRAVPPDQTERWVAAERAFARGQELHDAGEGGRRQALSLYAEALAAWRVLGDQSAQAETLTAMAAVGGFMEEPYRKLDCLRQALPLWKAVGDRYREAWTLAEIGVAHGILGATDSEREHHEQALALWRSLGNQRGEARALISLGAYHEGIGDVQTALDLVEQGLGLARRLEDPRVEAEAVRRLAGIRFSMGETRQAIELMERSRALWQAVGDRYREALASTNLATGYRQVGRNEEAREMLTRVLAMAREEGHVHLTAATLVNLGTYHRRRQELEVARDYYEQALELFRRQGQRWDQGQVLRRLGELDEAQGRWPAAAARYEEALRLSRETVNPAGESDALYYLARLDRARGRLDDARAHIESALSLVEGVRASAAREDFRTSYLASVLRFYELAVDLSAELDRERPGQGHAAAALHLAERARARSLLESLGEAQARIRKGADPALLARRREILRTVGEKAADLRLRRSSGPGTSASAEKEIDGLIEELQQVEARMRTASPLYAELALPQPMPLPQIQREIPDDDTLLLEYALGEERSHLWLVTRTTLTLVALPKRSEIEDLARRFHGLFQAEKFETEEERRTRRLQAEVEYPRLGARLSELVLGPAAKWLDRKRLVIVADGALQYVPFAALPLPESHPARGRLGAMSPLVTAHEIVSLPSASTLAVLPRGQDPGPPTVAVVADPVYDAADPRVAGARHTKRAGAPLPTGLQRSLEDVVRAAPGDRLDRLSFTRREAEAILALVPRPRRRAALDFEASRKTVESGVLADYRIVHFATHSLINGVHPELSGLVLSLVDRTGRAQDGFLRAHEIFDLDLHADLVVLSGCSTGLGRETRGEGLVGLTRGFMYAGAARVMVSLWDVQDAATATFMERFYGALLGQGLSPAAALREAQLASIRDARSAAPYYWAPFVMLGEWRR